MASTSTGTTSSTGTSTGSNRKRSLPSDSDPPPRPKKQKKETNLDTLTAELQKEVGYLKDSLINLREFFIDERLAKKGAELGYTVLLEKCNTILDGENPTPSALAAFQVRFANMFESEEVLRGRVTPSVLPCW